MAGTRATSTGSPITPGTAIGTAVGTAGTATILARSRTRVWDKGELERVAPEYAAAGSMAEPPRTSGIIWSALQDGKGARGSLAKGTSRSVKLLQMQLSMLVFQHPFDALRAKELDDVP